MPWLWNALGGEADDLTVDFRDVDLKDNDSLLLCTDGLTNRLSNVQLANRLIANGAAEICGDLVSAANAAGGQDNVTCCFVRFAADTSPSAVSSSCQSLASQAD